MGKILGNVEITVNGKKLSNSPNCVKLDLHKKPTLKIRLTYAGKDYFLKYDCSCSAKTAIFLWEEGNYSCDCNRSALLNIQYPTFPIMGCGELIKLTSLESGGIIPCPSVDKAGQDPCNGCKHRKIRKPDLGNGALHYCAANMRKDDFKNGLY